MYQEAKNTVSNSVKERNPAPYNPNAYSGYQSDNNMFKSNNPQKAAVLSDEVSCDASQSYSVQRSPNGAGATSFKNQFNIPTASSRRNEGSPRTNWLSG
jgi:hypothetical protein